ncbi:hypothetical protein B0A53_00507 [Rhodotorula sp. CCFEE 5036]|nr:hypothetical protein B0A53_00507 [Rhodotorula sp. CCFEE 5036]
MSSSSSSPTSSRGLDDEEQADARALPETIELSDTPVYSIELGSTDEDQEGEDEPHPTASSGQPPAHYRPSRSAPHGVPAARKSTFRRPAKQNAVRQRQKATAAGASSRKSRLKQPLIKQEEGFPVPSWPTSPAKPSQPQSSAARALAEPETPFGITFPFSIKLRLEQVRLSSDLAASRPIVELAVAFRHLDQSTRTASVASSTAFQVNALAHQTLDDGSLSITLDDLPQEHEFPVLRKPSRSPGTAATSQDLCDIGILATISPPAQQPSYCGWLSLVRTTSGTEDELVEEEDVARFLEHELRAAEADWRRETAARAQLLAKIEAQPPPAYGPPADLVLPANAPDPGSLIPGLNSQGPIVAATAVAPSFPPIPRYSYTSFASRAVPVPGHRLESFPHIPKWEDATATNKLIAEKYQSFLPFDFEDGPTPDPSSPEVDWLRDALTDLHAFQPPDNGRTVRDFRTLKRLLERLEREFVSASGDEEHNVDKRAAALELFRRRVGRSAQQVAEDHRLISAEELSPSEETVDWCAWCGAVACTVHACFVAYNRQTKPKKALPQPTSNEADSCDRCGQERCLMNSKLDRMNLDDAPREPPERLKGLDACTLSLILEQPFENVPAIRAPASPAPPARSSSKWWKQNILKPADSYGYVPCQCVDVCGDGCVCAESTYCDEFCNCPTSSACGNSHIRLGHARGTCLVVSQIPDSGTGLALLEPVSRNDLIGVYGGELFPKDAPQVVQDLTIDNAAGSWRAHMADAHPVSYWFEVDNADAVDSVELGGPTRFINHNAARANVEPRVVNISGTHQVAIYATKPLQAGEELFMDYGPSYYPDGGAPKAAAP